LSREACREDGSSVRLHGAHLGQIQKQNHISVQNTMP
jgi:hypothetical protein